MKKIILLIMCLFLCNIINAKTIKYKSDNILKECKIKITKNKSKTYNYHIHAKIEGKIVDVNNSPISNQPIYLMFNKNVSTIYSNNDGIFEYEIDSNLISYFKNVDDTNLAISLQFNNKNKKEFESTFKNGNDLLINRPHEIYIQLNRLYKELEISLYLSNNEIEKKEIIHNNKDIIVLSSQTFSAQYYRDKIKKQKGDALLETEKKLKENNINIKAENLILYSDGTLNENWKYILEKIIDQRKILLYSKKRVKDIGINNIKVEEIILIDGELNNNWEQKLENIIKDEAIKQARTKLKKQTGYNYYDSEVEEIICEYGYNTFYGTQIYKVKNNWKQLVIKEIRKQQQRRKEQQEKEEDDAWQQFFLLKKIFNSPL